MAGVRSSELTALILFGAGTPAPTDWTNRDAWQQALANDDTAGNFGKYLRGIGDMEVPERTSIAPVDGVDVTGVKVQTVNFRTNALTPEVQAFVRALQCEGRALRAWLYTMGQEVIGGPTGLSLRFYDAATVFAEGRDAVVSAQLTLRYAYRTCEPPRAVVPGLLDGLADRISVARVYAQGGTAFGHNETAYAQF